MREREREREKEREAVGGYFQSSFEISLGRWLLLCPGLSCCCCKDGNVTPVKAKMRKKE
jgi:hypothetical protein